MKLSSSFQMPKFSSSSSPMSWRLYGEDCGKVTKDVNLETIEPMYTQNYDPLSPPNPYTSERDLEDMLLDRSLRYMDKALLSKTDNEKCYLVGLEDKSLGERGDDTKFTMEESLTELSELSGAAGLSVVGSTYQRVDRPNIEYYIGRGKVKEISRTMMRNRCCCVVFDTELTPSQQKNLEISFSQEQSFKGSGKVQVKVLDRTALILDIFAQHARTREGQLQVQLALMTYRLPRLTNMWTHLERQSAGARGKTNGGVGLRGPGEMQLESDKREMRGKISKLRKAIDGVRHVRSMHRKRRRRLGVPVIALVGYTNAGKSSILNYLTESGVFAADILFATLDPTTRIVRLPGIKVPEVLLTDTVGFVQKLPTNLVAAFRATLEEISEADILIHVTDITNEARRKQEAAVLRELGQMGLTKTPVITVWNKIDMVPKLKEYYKYEARKREQTVAFSSKTGEGMEDLTNALQSTIYASLERLELSLSYAEINILSILYRIGVVESVEYKAESVEVICRVPNYLKEQLETHTGAGQREYADLETKDGESSTIGAEELVSEGTNSGHEDERYWRDVVKGRISVDGIPSNQIRRKFTETLSFTADWKSERIVPCRRENKKRRSNILKSKEPGVEAKGTDDEYLYDDSLLLNFDEMYDS